MKKLIIMLVLSWISLDAVAQWEQKYKAGISGGYEWNIFLNPVVVQGEEQILRRNDLWVNAFFQEAFVSADFTRKMQQGRFKIGGFVSGANYNSTINANRHSFRLNASYRTKYAARKYFEVAPEVYRVKRQGVNDQDAVLTTPFSYLKLTMPFKFDFYLKNKVWFKTTTGYIYKEYDQVNNNKISYHAGFTGATLSKKWKTSVVETKLSFTSRAEFRFYKNIEQFLEDDEDEPGGIIETDENTRLWTYFRNNLEYSIKPGHGRFDLKLGLYSTIRLDSEEENGYKELAPGIEGVWRLNNLTLSATGRYVNRNYPDREVGEQELPLRYQYLRGSIKAEVPVGEKSNFFIKTNLVNRESSNTRLTRGFRGYFNSIVEAGIVFKL